MKTGKLVIFNLLVFLASINILYLYFGRGAEPFSFTGGYLSSVMIPFLTILILFVSSLMVSLSYVVSYAKHKKNLLRIPMFMMGIILIISVIQRIREFMEGYYCISCVFNSILYLLILFSILFILKDLHILVRRLFANRK